MFRKIFHLIVGTKHERDIRKLQPALERINALEPTLQAMSNAELGAQTVRFRERLAAGESVDDLLPEAFATVREAAWRSLGMRHFDVQLIGGMVLHQGKIAEMKTGEGKTLTSTSAIYLNALAGKGVHVVTVNDYLARRDALWMKPVYDFLGVSVGIIQHNMDYSERQKAYACDITYGTNNEFGFDYLRDNMVTAREYRVQRGFHFGIVDEVDSILIDEARTPLIISGPTEENTEQYGVVDKAIRKLLDYESRELQSRGEPPQPEVEPGKEEPHVTRGWHYDVDEKSRNVLLTELGVQRVEEILQVDNLFAPDRTEFVAHVNQALRAHLIFKDEVDYIVRDGEVIIVDEHTGRMMEGRRYSDGLHQALEAKERVPVKKETQTLASITFQNFFRMYKKLAGMTGTADTEANEFKKIYNLEVVVVPTNVTVQRIDAPDRVYRTEAEKWNAIVEEIRDCYERGQPTLVGTVSVEKSEGLAGLLRKAGIPHSVLNAKQHEREAEVIMNAGKPHAVTVATNMAGRGTDIVLGGYPLYTKDLEKLEGAEGPIGEFRDFMLKKQFDQAAAVIGRISGQADQQLARDIHERALIWLGEHKKVKELGGLHILGTERHEARRIDNQLRGRSGRQGDPGSSRFYLSLEDHLMRIFGGERIKRIMTWVGMEEGQELEAGMVDRAIARAQKRVEGHNFDIRKHLLEYDEVMNRQREFVYAERNKLLDNDNVRDDLLSWAEEVVEAKIVEFCESNDVQRWEAEGLAEWLRNGLGVEIAIDPEAFAESRNPQLDLFNHIWTEAKRLYLEKVARVGEENFSYVERRIALDVIDARWKEHLYALDHLREGVWASGYAERNPLVEFKLEGFRMFDAMVESIKAQLAEFLFRVQIEGPVVPQTAAPRRTEGIASHQSLESFGDGGGPARAAPASGAIREAETTTSSGGASRRRSSRRRRR